MAFRKLRGSGRVTRYSYKALIQLFRLANSVMNDKGRYHSHLLAALR
jgi:hypothetical protein